MFRLNLFSNIARNGLKHSQLSHIVCECAGWEVDVRHSLPDFCRRGHEESLECPLRNTVKDRVIPVRFTLYFGSVTCSSSGANFSIACNSGSLRSMQATSGWRPSNMKKSITLKIKIPTRKRNVRITAPKVVQPIIQLTKKAPQHAKMAGPHGFSQGMKTCLINFTTRLFSIILQQSEVSDSPKILAYRAPVENLEF